MQLSSDSYKKKKPKSNTLFKIFNLGLWWWTETIQIRTLCSDFRKTGFAPSLICPKNCKYAYSSLIFFVVIRIIDSLHENLSANSYPLLMFLQYQRHKTTWRKVSCFKRLVQRYHKKRTDISIIFILNYKELCIFILLILLCLQSHRM